MSTINYSSEVAAARAKEDAERLDAANRAVFNEILALYPISDCEANFQMFLAFVNPMTVQGCEYLVKGDAKGFDLAWTSREQMIDELVELRRENASQKTLSDFDLRSWKVRISVWSLRQLREYKKKLLFTQSHQTAETAREYLAGIRKTEPNPFPGFPRLPQRMVLPYGPIQYTEINAEFLKTLIREDYFQFKHRFVNIYGMDQITARINSVA
jgi:hypothetical protein